MRLFPQLKMPLPHSCLTLAGTYLSLKTSPKGDSSRMPETTRLPQPISDLDVPSSA